MFGIGATGKRQLLISPVAEKSPGAVRPNGYYFGVATPEFVVVLAQLRQMLAAVGSGKTTQEDQDHVLSATQAGQVNGLALRVEYFEIRCWHG
jgi:hypothetical protein